MDNYDGWFDVDIENMPVLDYDVFEEVEKLIIKADQRNHIVLGAMVSERFCLRCERMTLFVATKEQNSIGRVMVYGKCLEGNHDRIVEVLYSGFSR